MEWCKNVIKSVIFLGILGIIIYGLSFILVPKDNTYEAGMPYVRPNGILAEPKNTIDVLIIGDSESYTSVSPMEMWDQYGFTSYVLGTNAQKIFTSYNFLIDALENQKPKVVILETNTFFRNLVDAQKIISFFERHVPFIKYHDRWKDLNLNDLGGDINYTGISEMKGYYYINYAVPMKESKPSYMDRKKKTEPIPKDEIYYIKKIYKLCKENNIELMFYSAPNYKNWWMAKHDLVSELAEELDINYLDTNLIPEIDIDWKTDTKDAGDHVNYKGALKVSTYLGKYLAETYNLPDHRGDSNYDLWNSSLEDYRKIIADRSIYKY